ncbi:glycerol-3-phosphate dehydrogenase [Helicobacter sp. 16-1353]|uniref:NAD(P)H-dependent glycerol-3-phosphate dehydrogenase n=1 Tax=Helicobacter sp. 16-1353 TaxID=2004996 RepID=UPI000DCE04D8|nr:NAD(P)H-dependent glycerol-3-phosphate dehydrogenase [Helicobacter sp. 16-1353]RAX55376.1 glycerol-3-phosphate dehydrogenase [Helicobacter sp. 16-1353]
MNIAVIGGGTWGRALAFGFSQKNNVGIVSRRELSLLKTYDSHKVRQISLDKALECKYIIIAIKSEAMREWLKNVNFKRESIVLVASKGIEISSGAFMCDIFKEYFPNLNIGYLMGPSFATEVLKGMPCALNIHTKKQKEVEDIANIFPSFMKIYFDNDVIGGEVGGAYKNIIAIAGGISDGLVLGNNAKASMIARGLVEMCRFGMFFGAKESTFLGLSGAGDLFLSANSILSRNYRVGYALAQNKSLKTILEELGEIAEGVLSTQAVEKLATKHNIYTPIAKQVHQILQGKSPKESVKELLGNDVDLKKF